MYIQECLDSIREQQGHFGIEIVWINDGSDALSTTLLEKALAQFQQRTRFCKIIYKKMETNMGVSYCLNQGIQLCTNEIVVRHDSDDIMLPSRIQTQLTFMNAHSDCVLLGSNVVFFTSDGDGKKKINQTQHPEELTWAQYKRTRSHWIMNHPSIMYKRSVVIDVGNYTLERGTSEDFELELKILKKYGKIYNIQNPLVLYRIHPDQVTAGGKTTTPSNPHMVMRRNALIESLM
jgi:glycosyltransferase involved in cell wall biosynthesis